MSNSVPRNLMSSSLTHTEQLVAAKKVAVVLLRLVAPDGGKKYVYLGCRCDRMVDLWVAAERHDISPEQYGIVIREGKGEPDVATRKFMQREYNFQHENGINFVPKLRLVSENAG